MSCTTDKECCWSVEKRFSFIWWGRHYESDLTSVFHVSYNDQPKSRSLEQMKNVKFCSHFSLQCTIETYIFLFKKKQLWSQICGILQAQSHLGVDANPQQYKTKILHTDIYILTHLHVQQEWEFKGTPPIQPPPPLPPPPSYWCT